MPARLIVILVCATEHHSLHSKEANNGLSNDIQTFPLLINAASWSVCESTVFNLKEGFEDGLKEHSIG